VSLQPPHPTPRTGFIGSYSESLSGAVISAGAVPSLKNTLTSESEDHIQVCCARGCALCRAPMGRIAPSLSCAGPLQAAVVWAFGQLGKHDAPHAAVLAESDVLRLILDAHNHEESSDGEAKAP
jgi:hypothetical protein